MAKASILVVEDQLIVSKDIQTRLKGMGYDVAGAVSSGEEAISKTAETRPDLVLMDIILKGAIDGIQAAQAIRDRLDIPIIYLTAHSDDTTLERANLTEPRGYVLKPFEDRALRATIELALYQHRIRNRPPHTT
ncbi:MAG: response regulator [Nitrospirae bacterium]|nr:response regulator [Nitrospirota bacterium]